MKKILRKFSILALLALALALAACGGTSGGEAAQESWENYLQSHNEKQQYYLEADYDGDGLKEAYAVTGDSFDYEGRTLSAKVYFISSTGKITCVLDKAPDGGTLCGWLENNMELSYNPNAVYIEEGNKKFIVWELDVRNGVSGSLILGVKNGEPYQPKISGEYIRFCANMNGTCSAYKMGDRLTYVFQFNASSGEYELIKVENSLLGQAVGKN